VSIIDMPKCRLLRYRIYYRHLDRHLATDERLTRVGGEGDAGAARLLGERAVLVVGEPDDELSIIDMPKCRLLRYRIHPTSR
jgi:hypothetical protein